MAMVRRSRFDFGATSWVTELSVQPWTPSDESVGGVRVAASGVPASYVVRRDALVELPLRVLEGEWATFLNLLHWGQSAHSLVWYPDASDTDTSFTCWWHGPHAGERVAPARDATYPRLLLVTITLRGVGTAVPWQVYFVDAP